MSFMNSSILRKLIPGILFGFLVLIGISLLGDVRQVSRLMLDFDWRVFPLVLLCTLFNYSLRFIKWHYYLGQIGVTNISRWQSLRLFVAGFPLAVTPGKAGEVLKAVWVKKLSGLPVAKGISVVLAERISDGLAVLALSTLGVIAYPRYWPAFVIFLTLLLGVVFLSQVRPAALWILALGEKLPMIKRIAYHLREFYEGSFCLFKPVSTLVAVGLGTVSWLGEGIGFYLILIGLGLPVGTSTLVTAVFVLSFSTIIGAASAMPGGMGAAEVSIAGMLTLLMGIQPALAAAATLLIRLATLWFGVGLGLLAWTVSTDLLGLRVENEQLAES